MPDQLAVESVIAIAWNTHELERRVANPAGPASCATFAAYARRKQLPPSLAKKVKNAFALDDDSCAPSWRSVTIKADASLASMRRLIESCPEGAPIGLESEGHFRFGVVVGLPLVSRIAQSELIESINVSCDHPPDIH